MLFPSGIRDVQKAGGKNHSRKNYSAKCEVRRETLWMYINAAQKQLTEANWQKQKGEYQYPVFFVKHPGITDK